MKEVANYMIFMKESSKEAQEYLNLVSTEISSVEKNIKEKNTTAFKSADATFTDTASSEDYWKSINA
jgi:flagellar hook protein FlgE